MRRRTLPEVFTTALLGVALAGCGALPWGQGGAEPMNAQRGAVVRVLGPAEIQAASQQLGAALEARWGGYLPLAATSPWGALVVHWEGLSLAIGRPTLDFVPVDGTSDDPGLRLQVPLEHSHGTLTLAPTSGETLCAIPFEVRPARLTVRLSLAADKLGRLQGVMLPGVELVTVEGARTNTVWADFTQCPPGLEAEALPALARMFADGVARTATDAVASELAPALGLDLAFGWSAPIAADALGSGYVRATLRAATDTPGTAMPDFIERTRTGLAIRFALSVAVDPHPCMGTLALAEGTPGPLGPLPESGTVLRLGALERIIGAAWLAGSACADHAGIAEVPRDEVALRWPALGRIDGGVAIELWPESVPTVRADPDLGDAVLLDFGRVRVDLIGGIAGARWRLGSVVVDLRVHGFISVGPEGVITFDPSEVDAVPAAVEAGLIGTPPIAVAEELVATLVDALIVEGPLGGSLGILPRSLATNSTRVWAAHDNALVLGAGP